MNVSLPLPEHQKLMVTYRVESGCLGPEGECHLPAFCIFAQQQVAGVDVDFIHWNIIPRDDKTLSEMQYSVAGKQLSHDKADKYLQLLGKSLDELEDQLLGKTVKLIDRYFDR